MSHTPGPWQVPDDNHVGVYGGDEQTLIATVARTPDRIANAQLIAAAPELLAALRDLQHQLHHNGLKLDVRKHYSLLVADAAAGKAIAKAEGK